MRKSNTLLNFKVVLIILIILFILSFLLNKKEGYNNFYDLKPSMKKIYQDSDNIEISVLNNYGKCLIIDGEIQLCDKKEHIYHEMIVHFPRQYVTKKLENVLIIGGGDLMTLREVMKYKTIKRVYMLELSPTIVNICKKYFNQSDFDDDKRVEIIYGDASKTILDIIDDVGEIFDMIIIDTTEDNRNNLPVDKPDFFMNCFKVLNETGVIVKNGISFKRMFEEYDDLNTIAYNVDIPYFQEKYYFIILAKPSNNIRKININSSRWKLDKVKTIFYNQMNHNKFIIYEDYNIDENDYEDELFFKKDSKNNKRRINILNDDDMFKQLF